MVLKIVSGVLDEIPLAKLSLIFKKSSRPPIFVRNPRWARPTRACLIFLSCFTYIYILLMYIIHIKQVRFLIIFSIIFSLKKTFFTFRRIFKILNDETQRHPLSYRHFVL